MPSPPDSPSTFPRLVGRAVERVEDAALLTGRGRFADDVGERPGTAHAAVLRSPHAHAEIVSLDAAAALSMPEVVTVLTGAEVAAWSRPFMAGVKQPMRHYALAVDRVRYTGEPVAVARDRYGAEDALERIEVEYRELDPVVDPVAAAAPGAPLLHRDVGSNVVSDRHLRYGDPDAAFASAAHRVAISVRYPRNACTSIEGFVVVAEHLGEDGYDVLSNFQGPFTLHPVMALALGVPGARLRLRSPGDSGGSFGVKQAVFPYVVAMCLASRKAPCPVKWVEDRLEHLLAARYEPMTNIVQLAIRLQGSRLGLAIDDIETEFNVSRRTAERLRNAVELSFGPLEEVETGERRKRWRLRSNPLQQLIRVAPEELAELESAAEGLDRAGLSERAKAIREVAGKLRALSRPRPGVESEDELEVLMRTEGLAMRAGPRPHIETGLLPLLREALTAGRVIEFEYRARTKGATSCQRVEPYGVLYGNRAFLVGPTDWADEPRLWRLDRMRDARIFEDTFERDPEFDLRSYAERSFGTFQESPVEVVLRFDVDAAHDARSFLFHPSQASEWNEDGTITVRFRAGGIQEMCWHLVTWGKSVIVEKPLRLRRRLAEMGQALATHHGPRG